MTPTGHRRLILTRHAKSAWDDPTLSDEARPLNERGRRSAREIGDWLASRGYDPEEVLCSTAARTIETWERAAEAVFETLPKLRKEAGLYQASPEQMLAVLRTATAPTVMMIGHNPAIGELAAMLPARAPMSADFRSYPTGATLVVDFDVPEWSQVQAGQGDVRDFVRLDGRS